MTVVALEPANRLPLGPEAEAGGANMLLRAKERLKSGGCWFEPLLLVAVKHPTMMK